MKGKIIITTITLQLILIAFLGYKIYQLKNNILGAVNISPIKKENIVYTPNSALKYFYELKANQDQIDSPPWLKKKAIYSINADSLNERFDYSPEKPTDTYRIITLGDSYTFGAYVNTKDNWSEQLEDLLNSQLICSKYKKFEVINLGVSGYDIQYEVERYRIRGQKYNPDLILWFLKDDDFITINEITTPIGKKYNDEFKKNGTYEEYYKNGTLNYLNFKMRNDWLQNKYDINKIVDYQMNAIVDINKYFNKTLVIFNFLRFNINLNKFSNLFKQNRNYIFFDGSGNCDKKFCNQEYSFKPYDYHPNEKGHQLITDKLFNYLIDNQIVNCNK